MKNLALVVLFIATVAFASLYLRQTRKAIEAQTAAEVLEQKVSALETSLDEEEKRATRLRAEVEQVHSNAAAKDRQIVELRAMSSGSAPKAAANSRGAGASKSSNPMASIAKLFDDPEMKDALAAQQKAALGPMIDRNYAQLFSELGLTAEQASALKEMLLKKQLGGAQVGMSFLSEDAPGMRTNIIQQMKAANEAADAEMKALLGEEKFAQLQSYEKSMADRMAVSGLKDQLGTGAGALTPEQEQQLIAAMTQERQNFKFSAPLPNKDNFTGDFSAMLNEERLNAYLQEADQLNQRFLGHAQNILTPDQLDSFQKYLNNQQAMQKAGMQMMKAFAPGKSETTP